MASTHKKYLNKTYVSHILFWLFVFLYSFVSSMDSFANYSQLLDYLSIITFLQIATAYIVIHFLIPKFLNPKKNTQFIFLLFLLLMGMFTLYNLHRTFYYDLKHIDSFSSLGREYAKVPFLYKLLNWKVFLGKVLKFLTPTVLLLVARFYKNQQSYLKLNEQKKIAELTALKHQLNPHFLFNTLNNLYALAIEKSDKTPEVIERLSDILDYMLYRCNDNFVSLQKEIELIDNYLALEKIRYGKRVNISFKTDIKNDVNIAPLLLLTFIENAFKHGVSQELKNAKINITLKTVNKNIVFSIFNTKPKNTLEKISRNEALGLKNVRKQLDLLYPNTYNLEINDNDSFSLILTLA